MVCGTPDKKKDVYVLLSTPNNGGLGFAVAYA